MKKILFILVCLVILPFSVFSQENVEDADADDSLIENDFLYEDADSFKEDNPLWIKDRKFEIGLSHINLGISNDFLSTSDIFKKTFILDLDELGKGFNMNMNMFVSPLFFNYNNDGHWGFGFSTGLSFSGDISLSGDMLLFKESRNNKSELAAAVFAELGAPVFFHVDNFKIKVRPTVYYPLMYMKSDVKYTYYNTVIDGEGRTVFKFELDPLIYTAFSMDDFNGLTASPGLDFHIGAEYPLSKVLGLTNIHSLLDFNVGLDFYGIPLFSSTMKDYMTTPFIVGSDEPMNIFNIDDDDESFITEGETEYGQKKKNVFRPFKMHVWADWHPLGSEFLTVTPLMGFSVNSIYNNPASFEWSLKGGINLYNLFIPSIKIGYYDRLWKNNLDLILNLRAFQLDLGLSLQASTFAKSWSGGGFGFNFGFKFGW